MRLFSVFSVPRLWLRPLSSGLRMQTAARGFWRPLLVLTILTGCDGGPSAPQIASVRVDAPASSVVVGETLSLQAVPLDPRGEPISGLSASWSSTAPSVLEVDAQGMVTGRAVGSAVVRADINGVVGTRTLQVVPIPVASIEVIPNPVEVVRGTHLTVEVILRSASGEVLDGRVPLFSMSNPQTASVSATGQITGNRAGTTSLQVQSGTAQIQVPVSVLPGDEPVVQGLTPDPIREGVDVEIEGLRFSPERLLNEVRLGDSEVEVLEASETRLLVRVPPFLCAPVGPLEVTVSVGGEASAPFVVPFESTSELALQPGEFHRVSGEARPCFRLPPVTAGAAYIIGVQSISENTSSTVPVRARGLLPAALAEVLTGIEERVSPAIAYPSARASFREVVAQRLRAADPRSALMARHRVAERDLREREANFLRSQGMPGPRSALRGPVEVDGSPEKRSAAASVPGTVQVNDTVDVRIPDLGASSFCTSFIPIRAVVRRVGSGAIWLEDVATPPPGLSGSDYAALGGQFDEQTLPVISEHFGEPTDIDGNGRIVVVISQEVNRFGGVLGFVVTTDFFPSTGGTPGVNSCPSSNEGEFYYTVTPDPQGQITPPAGAQPVQLSLSDFRSLTPRLAAHEATHVIQFGRRLLETPGATGLGTVWELEGQAVVAEEVVGYADIGSGPRRNLGFEVAFDPSESRLTDWFSNAFVDLAVYYGFQSPTSRASGAPAGCSWLGRVETSGPCNYGRLAYGPSWSFQRWVMDHYGSGFTGGEAELQRRLVQSTAVGFAAFEQVLGEPVAPLLARWAASLYTDGRLPSGADPRLSFPSWNLREIDGNLVETASLLPVSRSFGNVNVTQTVAAGSSFYLRVSGTTQPAWAFRVTAPEGGALPAHVQVWVVRLP